MLVMGYSVTINIFLILGKMYQVGYTTVCFYIFRKDLFLLLALWSHTMQHFSYWGEDFSIILQYISILNFEPLLAQ